MPTDDKRYAEELAFWRKEFTADPKLMNPWMKKLLDPTERLKCIGDRQMRIIQGATHKLKAMDLGCGPISMFQTLHDIGKITLVGVDPLADKYDRLMQEIGAPLMRYQAVFGEELTKRFKAGTFDFIHVRNALDHSRSPRTCVEQIAQLLCKRGVLMIESKINEGTTAGWNGCHRWNLRLDPGGATVWCHGKDEKPFDLFDKLPLRHVDSATSGNWFNSVRQRV